MPKYYDTFMVDQIEKLLAAYKAKHPIITSKAGLFLGADRHCSMIISLLKSAQNISEPEERQHFLNQLASSFDAGAKTAFPDEDVEVARANFIKKLNAQPNDHLYYRSIGLILKNDKKDEFKHFNTLVDVEEKKDTEFKAKP